MRAFRMVSSVLLQQYLHSGSKTFERISAYVEEARQHPTGKHWVDNLLIYQHSLCTNYCVQRERVTGPSNSFV